MPRRVAVVAGAGALAPQVIAAALLAGDEVCAFCLSPQQLPDGVELRAASLEHPDALFDGIRGVAATHLVLAGAVTLTDGDRQRLIAALGGDGPPTGDAVLSRLALRLQERTGAVLTGPHEIVPELLAGAGPLAGPVATGDQMAAARLALRAARQVGAMDLGQAAVVSGARVVAAEDVAGTDELLARVAGHVAAGLLGQGGDTPVVLAKACKPQQPLFVDLPAIGPTTIAGAAAAGISLIAVEAGRTLVLERQLLVADADALGISVVGMTIDG